MNRKVFLLILVFLCLTVHGARRYDVERGNDSTHIETARRISGIEGVKDAAVLSCKKRVLAGVRLKGDANAEKIAEKTERLLKKSFPKAKSIHLCVGGDDAEKVVELSLYMESGINRKTLKKRFEFLFRENRRN